MLARPTCVMGRIVCGCGLVGLIYAFNWPLVPKDCTEYQKNERKIKKNEGVSIQFFASLPFLV